YRRAAPPYIARSCSCAGRAAGASSPCACRTIDHNVGIWLRREGWSDMRTCAGEGVITLSMTVYHRGNMAARTLSFLAPSFRLGREDQVRETIGSAGGAMDTLTLAWLKPPRLPSFHSAVCDRTEITPFSGEMTLCAPSATRGAR